MIKMFGMINKKENVLAKSSKVLAKQTENHDNHMISIGIPTFARTTLARRLFRADISANYISAHDYQIRLSNKFIIITHKNVFCPL
jgi:hypothetical protein